MPAYNFIEENELELDKAGRILNKRVKAEYSGNREFDVAESLVYSEKQVIKTFIIKNCEGSLIFIDKTKGYELDKLHIGDLIIRNPHIESSLHSRETGPRVDLHEFDIAYSLERLRELESWRTPAKREELRKRYSKEPISKWYSTRHRLIQLQISQGGLEGKIKEHEELVTSLRSKPNNTFVSERARYAKEKTKGLIDLISQYIQEFQKKAPEGKKPKPKIISAPDVLGSAQEIHALVTAILNFVVPKIDIRQATRYWKEVDVWAEM